MKRSELTEFAVEEEGFKLKIRRGTNGLPIVSGGRGSNPPFQTADTTPPMAIPAAGSNSAATALNAGLAPAGDEPGISYVKSPMVGTFYRAPSPESKSFADVGLKVT